MKRKWLAMGFLLMAVGMGFCDAEKLFQVSMLIEDGIDKNMIQINEVASSLSGNEKLLLYNRYEKDMVALPFIMNLLVGLGIGSYIQGDVWGGTIGLVGEITSYTLFFLGSAQSVYDYRSGILWASSGAILFFVTRIYELVSPFTYEYSYNKKLREALGVYTLGFEILPSMNHQAVSVVPVVTFQIP